MPHPLPTTLPNPRYLARVRPVTRKRFKKVYRELLVWKYRCRFLQTRVRLLRSKFGKAKETIDEALSADSELEESHDTKIQQIQSLPLE